VCSRVAIIRSGKIVAIESVSVLRRRLVRRMTVTFRHAPPDTLGDIPGVEHIDVADRVVTFAVRGDVNPLLRLLAGSDVEEMIFPEPQLEDAFLGYYEGVAQ
jgi:ABC-2 type transport system ATP-binding protein